MLKLIYENKNKLTSKDYLIESLKKLSVSTKYQIVKLISFNSDKTHIIVKSQYYSDCIKTEKFFVTQCLCKESSKSFFNLVIEEKKVLKYCKENQQNLYIPYIKDIENELYIPLVTNDNDIIGCLYLGTYDKTLKNNEQICNFEVQQQILKINDCFQMLYKQQTETEEFFNVVQIISEIAKNKEPYMVTHPYNVALWATTIAKKLNLHNDKILILYVASLLHDIGKLYINKDILNKSSPLNEEEYDIVKKHSIYGYNIVSSLPRFGCSLSYIAKIVKHHHERYDGNGYPDQLKGHDIPLESRIIAVADAVDAMLSNDSYKETKNIDTVIKELMKNRGKQFDPDIANIMIQILSKTKEMDEDILSSPIIWSTITIVTEESIYTFDGTLVKYDSVYIFKTNIFDFSQIDKSQIKKISLYVKEKKNVIEYDIKLDYINFKNNRIYIADLKIKPIDDSFTMLWNLDGILYVDSNNIEINIYKIGGNCLSFKISNSHSEIVNNGILALRIIFEDSSTQIITGKITRKFQISDEYYYEYKYINTPDFIRDKIFRQLFKKQVEIRRLINQK